MTTYSARPGDATAHASAGGVMAVATGAAGLAAAMTVLYRAMAVIMETEGGFVAVGGPYEIAHPAPGWVWLVPVAILSMFAFGGLSLWAALRGWGLNPIACAWSALFFSLGWNFLRLGLIDPPEGMGAAWGWIVSGAVFWVMALIPALGPLGRRVAAIRYGPDALTAGVRTGPFGLPIRATSPVLIAVQAASAIAGVGAGLALFAAIAG